LADYLCCKRNKRSITLDLKPATGLEILGRLIERADVRGTGNRTLRESLSGSAKG